MAAETRRFQKEHANLAGVNRTLERMPEETKAMLKQHIAAWRDGEHDRWARYLFEDLAAIVDGEDRGAGAQVLRDGRLAPVGNRLEPAEEAGDGQEPS